MYLYIRYFMFSLVARNISQSVYSFFISVSLSANCMVISFCETREFSLAMISAFMVVSRSCDSVNYFSTCSRTNFNFAKSKAYGDFFSELGELYTMTTAISGCFFARWSTRTTLPSYIDLFCRFTSICGTEHSLHAILAVFSSK